MGFTFVTLLYPDVYFIQPVLWTWSLRCGTSVPVHPFLTSHYLKAKFAAKISIKTHGNAQEYVFKLSLTQVSFTAQTTVCILLMNY